MSVRDVWLISVTSLMLMLHFVYAIAIAGILSLSFLIWLYLTICIEITCHARTILSQLTSNLRQILWYNALVRYFDRWLSKDDCSITDRPFASGCRIPKTMEPP